MQEITKIKSDLKEDRIIVIAGIFSWILLISFYKVFCSNALSQTMLALFTFIGALLLPLAGMTIPFIVFYLSDKYDLKEAQEKAKHQHAKKEQLTIYTSTNNSTHKNRHTIKFACLFLCRSFSLHKHYC